MAALEVAAAVTVVAVMGMAMAAFLLTSPLANALLFPHRSTQRSHRAATLLIPVHPREVSIPPRHPLQSHLLVLVLVTLTDLPSALTGKATKLLARLNR